jgi:DNA invertase Pin-like site-specific DNA recombinase
MKHIAIYSRVSTFQQDPRSQHDALRQYITNHGLANTRWYTDHAAGTTTDRPAFAELQTAIFNGQVSTVIVWKLDRLARSLRDGINILADWCEKGIRVVSITQQLDLSGPIGRTVAALLLGVAEIERENISERIRAGIAAAKKRGVKFGRPAWKTRPYRTIDPAEVLRLRSTGMTMTAIAHHLHVTRQACYKAIAGG